jgi:response regulator RpfG family c-di-GMP phosphodiesterase
MSAVRKEERCLRVLLVDDEPGIRTLLKTTLESLDVQLDEAQDAASAVFALKARRPDAIVLDVNLPGMNGLTFCSRLKRDPQTRDIPVVLLTGEQRSAEAVAAGADAFLQKPFSPLELLSVVERVAGANETHPTRPPGHAPDEQLLLYARDLRHLLEIERAQRRALQHAYRQTVGALASALESKDTGTRAHSQRVQRYALELARAIDPDLAEDPSAEYGFLLHDVGKIGVPDRVLLKPGPLTDPELALMRTHTLMGAQMLDGIAFLDGAGIAVVRSHHERWDGAGYPDGLAGEEIPLGARVFSVADTLDAITSDRPYREAQPWETARDEIVAQAGRQFDPAVVEAYLDSEHVLRDVQRELRAA